MYVTVEGFYLVLFEGLKPCFYALSLPLGIYIYIFNTSCEIPTRVNGCVYMFILDIKRRGRCTLHL